MLVRGKKGFTLVELLIVIVVIGILAAISIVAYSGIQQRARTAKIQSDLSQIQKAVTAARILSNSPLFAIYANSGPEGPCIAKVAGADLASFPRSDACWTGYIGFLAAVSTASGMNINGIVDPWGRPYYVNPNEDEGPLTHVCLSDQIGTYTQPFAQSMTNVINIPLFKASC